MRNFYRLAVALHPPAFRSQFGAEMELIFEECGRPPRLVGDILISLVRQWILRTKVWLFLLATVGGFVPFLLAMGFLRVAFGYFGMAPLPPRAHGATLHGVTQPVTAPFILMTAMTALVLISGGMTLAIAWFRHAQKLRER